MDVIYRFVPHYFEEIENRFDDEFCINTHSQLKFVRLNATDRRVWCKNNQIRVGSAQLTHKNVAREISDYFHRHK